MKNKSLNKLIGQLLKTESDIYWNNPGIFVRHILPFSTHYRLGMKPGVYYQCLSDKKLLTEIMKQKLMTAPGIVHPEYANPQLLTKTGKYGFIDCYANWDDTVPLTEEQRLHQ